MVTSKNQLITILKKDKNLLQFKTIKNTVKCNYQDGIIRNVGIVQSNAFTLLTDKNGDGKLINSWIYLNDIEVISGIIKYKNFNIELEIQEVNREGIN